MYELETEEIYYKEVVHMIVEARKSQDLQGDLSKLDTQESWWSSSILKAGSLVTKEPMFQFKPKGRKKPMSHLEAFWH